MKQPVQRRLAAILAADVAGYSRLMGADEEGTHERFKAHLAQLIDPKIREHRGRTVKNTGDGVLAEFSSVIDAVRCAAEVQRGMADRNAATPEDKRIAFRVGINLGDVIVEANDIYGDGVNVAARLEALAEPGGICVSRVVRDQVRGKLPYPFEDRGEHNVKNIARPLRVYALRPEAIAELPSPGTSARTPRRRRIPPFVTPAAVSAALLIAAGIWWMSSIRTPPSPLPAVAAVALENVPSTTPAPPAASAPRLSVVVLPFDSFGDRPEDAQFVGTLTDDVTTRLAKIPNAFVVARTTAVSFKGSPLGAQEIAAKLGVRYVVEGSLHRLGDKARLNAQLIDATTGVHVWAGRFDADAPDDGQSQRHLIAKVIRSLRIALLDAEARRLERQPSSSLTAADLLLQVEAYRNHPPTSEQDALAIERLEKALQLEPRSVEAMVALSKVLLRPLMQFGPDETTKVRVRRAQNLIDEARKIAPDIRHVLDAQAVMLVTEGRWDEAQSAYRHLLDRYPDDVHLLNQVAICSIVLGRSEEALPLLRKAVSLGPDDPWAFTHEANLGLAFVRLGRDGEAVEWLRRAKQDAPVVPASVYSLLAAAYAQLGRIDDAHRELAAYIAKEPWVTVRWLRHRRRSSEVAVAERTREIDGLAKAGLRDHAEEDADGGLDRQLDLRPPDYLSPTPLGAPGVTTITTADLSAMLSRDDGTGRPVIFATTRPRPDFRLPMSHELPGVFAGDEFDGEIRHTLVEKVSHLTRGDKKRPVVTAGWNSERWSSRNLALQLVALGYESVYWYRGGFEAWDVAGLPEESQRRPAAPEGLSADAD